MGTTTPATTTSTTTTTPNADALPDTLPSPADALPLPTENQPDDLHDPASRINPKAQEEGEWWRFPLRLGGIALIAFSIFVATLFAIIQWWKSVRAARQERKAANAKEDERADGRRHNNVGYHGNYQSRGDYQSRGQAETFAGSSDAGVISQRQENGAPREGRWENGERDRPNTNTKDIIFHGMTFWCVPMQMHSNESSNRNRRYIRVDYMVRLPIGERGGKEVRKHKYFWSQEFGTPDEAVGAAREWIKENLTVSGHLKSGPGGEV